MTCSEATSTSNDGSESLQAVSGLLLPVAIDNQGLWRTATEVPRGKACDCRCPGCDQPVVARRGERRRPHFAHLSRTGHLRTCNETALHRLCKDVLRNSVGKCIKLPDVGAYNVRITSVKTEVMIDVVARKVDLLADVSLESHGAKKPASMRKLAVEICVSNSKDREYCLDMKKAGIPAVEIVVSRKQVLKRMTKTNTKAESALRVLLLSMTVNKRWLHRKDMKICPHCQRYELPDHKTNGVTCGLIPCPTCGGYMRQDSGYGNCRRCRRRAG